MGACDDVPHSRRLADRGRITVAAFIGIQLARAQEPVRQPRAQAERQAFLPEPPIIVRAIDFAMRTIGDGSGEKSGLYPEFSNMATDAGWISIGPGYRQWFGGDRIVVDASAAVSWREFTQNTYFG